jgi:hypothetical protein
LWWFLFIWKTESILRAGGLTTFMFMTMIPTVLSFHFVVVSSLFIRTHLSKWNFCVVKCIPTI